MSNIYYVVEYKKTKDIMPTKTSLIAQYPYEIVSGVGDDISVNGKTYVIADVQYLYGGDALILRSMYVIDNNSKEVL